MKYKTIEEYQIKTGYEIRSVFMDGEFWISVFKSEALPCGNEERMLHDINRLKCEEKLLKWANDKMDFF